MKTNARPFTRLLSRNTWGLSVGSAMAAMLLVAMGASASDERDTQAVRAISVAPAERSASDIQWNQREDRKAGDNVGLPGIY